MKHTGPVLFDLDGTLVDTAADISLALNRTLEQAGREAIPLEEVRPHISNGSAALIELGFGVRPGDKDFDRLCESLLSCYASAPAQASTLFTGMDEVLQSLDDAARLWGIVTNKLTYLTQPLVRALGLEDRAACVVCGDTATHPKPHPAPLLYACEQLGCVPAEAIYVGDARRDVEAGQAAGMPTVVALYGYLGTQGDPRMWQADAMIQTPVGLLSLLG